MATITWEGGLLAFVVLEERPEDGAELTRHPVEGKAPVADNVVVQPVKLNLSTIFSDDGTVGQSYEEGRARRAYETLLGLLRRADLVTVTTPLRVYPSFVLISVVVAERRGTSSIRLDVGLEERLGTTAQEVEIPAAPARRGAGGRRGKGGLAGEALAGAEGGAAAAAASAVDEKEGTDYSKSDRTGQGWGAAAAAGDAP
jgi:hypothetical protein